MFKKFINSLISIIYKIFKNILSELKDFLFKALKVVSKALMKASIWFIKGLFETFSTYTIRIFKCFEDVRFEQFFFICVLILFVASYRLIFNEQDLRVIKAEAVSVKPKGVSNNLDYILDLYKYSVLNPRTYKKYMSAHFQMIIDNECGPLKNCCVELYDTAKKKEITCYGINKKYFTEYHKAIRGLPNAKKKQLASLFFFKEFYLGMGLDKINKAWSMQILDYAIHYNKKIAVQMAQEVINIKADGVLGKATIRLLNNKSNRSKVSKYINKRHQSLKRMKKYKSGKYKKGWDYRIGIMKKLNKKNQRGK